MHCSLQERKYGWGLQSMKSKGRVLAWQRWSLLHTERRSSLRRPVLSTQKTQPRTVAGAAPQHASQSHCHTGASQRMLTLGAVIVTSCQSSQTMEKTTVSDQLWVAFHGFCFYTSCICIKKMSILFCPAMSCGSLCFVGRDFKDLHIVRFYIDPTKDHGSGSRSQ